jgi:hypothetical protein
LDLLKARVMAYGIARIAQKDAVPNKLAPIIVQGISGDNTIFIGFFAGAELPFVAVVSKSPRFFPRIGANFAE